MYDTAVIGAAWGYRGYVRDAEEEAAWIVRMATNACNLSMRRTRKVGSRRNVY